MSSTLAIKYKKQATLLESFARQVLNDAEKEISYISTDPTDLYHPRCLNSPSWNIFPYYLHIERTPSDVNRPPQTLTVENVEGIPMIISYPSDFIGRDYADGINR